MVDVIACVAEGGHSQSRWVARKGQRFHSVCERCDYLMVEDPGWWAAGWLFTRHTAYVLSRAAGAVFVLSMVGLVLHLGGVFYGGLVNGVMPSPDIPSPTNPLFAAAVAVVAWLPAWAWPWGVLGIGPQWALAVSGTKRKIRIPLIAVYGKAKTTTEAV